MILRPAAMADIPRLQVIDALSFPAEEQFTAEKFTELLTTAGLHTIAGVRDGVVVGYLLVDTNREPARLRSIAVHPDARRCGLGELLVQEARGLARGVLELLVAPENVAAIGLYRRLGFNFVDVEAGMPNRRVMRTVGA